MRLLTAALILSLLTGASCSQADQNSQKEVKESLKKEEAIIKGLFKPLEAQGVKVKEIKLANEVKIPGFNTFEVTIKDERKARELKKYIFISEDGNYLALQMFKVATEGDTARLTPVTPKNPVKPLKVDLSWLKDVDKKLEENNIPHVIGKSDRKIYIVWDIFCPFCYKHFNQIEEIAKKNNVELHMIPLPVHGENSVKGFLYYTQLARERGAAQAFKELYSLGNGDFRRYAEEIQKKEVKLPKEEQERLKAFFEELQAELLKKGVQATPSIIYIPPGEKDRGYIIVGFKPIEEVLKMK